MRTFTTYAEAIKAAGNGDEIWLRNAKGGAHGAAIFSKQESDEYIRSTPSFLRVWIHWENVKKPLPAVNLILSDARGVYIPRDFVTDQYNEIAVDHCARWNISIVDAEILAAGPESEFYWETWETVLNTARYIDVDGAEFILFQDGDLFAFCFDKMLADEKINFGLEE